MRFAVMGCSLSSLLDVPAHLALVLSLAATTVGSEPAGPSLFTGRSTPTPVATLNLKTVDGPFRFGEGAWLRALKDSLPPNEAPPFASGIFQTSGGRYYVPATSDRPLILNERHNLALSARVAQAYAQSNARALRTSLQRAPSAGELYIAHIFGHEAASDFVRAVESSPDAIAAVRLADLARAAPEVFLQKTCAQVYQQVTAAVHARIPQSGPRVRILTVKREPRKPSIAEPALFSMGQSMANAREANKSVAWQTEVNIPNQ
jgi:hypothetical protein